MQEILISQFPTEHIVEMGIGVEHDIRITRRMNHSLILDFVMYSINKTYRYIEKILELARVRRGTQTRMEGG